jgi:prepilin-type N-terminal cleavage/methylation domain-containing protein
MTASSRSAIIERRRKATAGFTLTELAVVLTIVAVLLSSLMWTLSAQTEARSRDDSLRRLEQARELLISFAIVRGRLPCPARCSNFPDCNIAGDGGDEANVAGVGSACTDNYAGYLPGRAIGFQPTDSAGYALDAWGNRIRYAVSATQWGAAPSARFTKQHVANDTTAAWSVAQAPGDLLVCASSTAAGFVAATPACGANNSVTNQNVVVAVVWSQGKNWATMPAGNVDEQINNKHRLPAPLNNNPTFVWHDLRPVGATGGEYDDLLLWIPVGQFYGRLISAGVLP